MVPISYQVRAVIIASATRNGALVLILFSLNNGVAYDICALKSIGYSCVTTLVSVD